MRRIRTWSAAGLLVALVASLPAGPAAAPSAAPVRTAAVHGPVGGPQLGTTGTLRGRGTRALPKDVVAPSFVVADLTTGAIYAARNPHRRTRPASCLKMLTALVLLPRLSPTSRAKAMDSDVRVDGTRVGIVPKLTYTVNSLFQALLLNSGNDAAEMLARIGGGRRQTLAAMNAEAARLNALDTHAATPSGLDGPGQLTSAYDLALIDRAAMGLPAYRRYLATRRVRFAAVGHKPFEVDNKNRLLLDDYPGALGGKDGFTDAARHTFVAAARRGGRTYLVALTHTDRTYGKQAEHLLDWAFALPRSTQPVGELVRPGPLPTPSPVAATPSPQVGAPFAASARQLKGRLQSHPTSRWEWAALALALLLLAVGLAVRLSSYAVRPRR